MTNATIPRPLADLGRRFGYAVAAGINAVLYFIVSNIVEWQWPGFITSDFDRVDEIILVSVVAGVVANVTYIWNDTMPLKAFMEASLNTISLVATIRLWQVFPFDFSENSFDWSWVARFVLVVAMFGTGVSLVVNGLRGVRTLLATD